MFIEDTTIKVKRPVLSNALKTTWHALGLSTGKKSETSVARITVKDGKVFLSAFTDDLSVCAYTQLEGVSVDNDNSGYAEFRAKPIQAILDYRFANDTVTLIIKDSLVSLIVQGKKVAKLPVFDRQFDIEAIVEPVGTPIGMFGSEQIKSLTLADEFSAKDQGGVLAHLSGVHLYSDKDYLRFIASDGMSMGYSWEKRKSEYGNYHVLLSTNFLSTLDKICRFATFSGSVELMVNSATSRVFAVTNDVTVYTIQIANQIRDKFPVQAFFKVFSSVSGTAGCLCKPDELADAFSTVAASGSPRVKTTYNAGDGSVSLEADKTDNVIWVSVPASPADPIDGSFEVVLSPGKVDAIIRVFSRITESIGIWHEKSDEVDAVMFSAVGGNFICLLARMAQ